MIRAFREEDLPAVMRIWLETNVRAHDFVPGEYWTEHYAMVKEALPQAEIYVYEGDETHEIDGFIGFTGDYVEGIFVREAVQSRGIGRRLLNHAKAVKPAMRLSVYQKNARAVAFYLREQFVIQSESVDEGTGEREFRMTWSGA